MIPVRISLSSKIIVGVSVSVLIMLFYAISNNKPTVDDTRQISLLTLLRSALKSAEAGGRYVVSSKDRLKIDSKGKTLEGLDDSVTTADFMSHCAIVKVFKDTFADLKVISEEKDVRCGDYDINSDNSPDTFIDGMTDEYVSEKDITVWIDPLDATHEYTEKLYEYVTTMVCIAVKGEPIIGVVHNPFSKATSWAWVGNGMSSDLRISKAQSRQKLRIVISRSHSGSIEEALNKSLKNFELVPAAGAGYKALKVAKGEADAYLHATAIKKWDICAGNAILNAVGGRMTTKHNLPVRYSDETDVVNRDGLVATLKDHQKFLNTF